MTAVVPANPKVQFCDALGVPLAIGTVDVYLAGTVTRTTTWQDQTKLSANTNPIALDSRGECVIWGDSSVTYKYVLKNEAGVEQYTVDNIPGAADIGAAATAAAAAAQVYADAAEAAQAAAEAAQVAAETAETNAESARDTGYGNAPIFTGTRPAATTAGVAAVASTQVFKTRQQYGNAVDVWVDSAGTPIYQETQPFGLGETAETIKAIEGATCDDWPVQPDFLFDCLDMHKWDGRVMPNRMAVTDPSKNLYPLNTDEIRFPGGGGATVTKRFAAGPSGSGTTAARVVWASNNVNSDYVNLFIGEIVPAATYSVVVALKSNSGAGFNIQNYESQGGTTGTLAITTSWVDYTFTFTSTGAADTVRLRGTVAGGSDFLIDRVRIYEQDGLSTPAWANNTGGHAKSIRSVRGTFLSDGLFWDATNSTHNPAVFPLSTWPDATTISDISILVCASADDTSQDLTASVISADSGDGVNSPVAMNLGTGNSSPDAYRDSGSLVSYPNSFEYNRINIKGEGFHVWGVTINDTLCRKFFDGIQYWNYDNGFTSVVARELCLGGTANTSKFKGKISQAAVWINRGLSKQDMLDATDCMEQRLNTRGKTLGSFRDVLMSEGDSRNAWSSASPDGPGWNHQLAAHNYFGTGLPSLKMWNIGWGSSTLGTSGDTQLTETSPAFFGSTVYSRLTLALARIAEAHAKGLRVIFTYLNDINDSVEITAGVSAYSTKELAYLTSIRTALDAGGLGSKLFLFTCTPKHTASSFETARASLNTLRRAYSASVVHGIIDVAADATLGTYSGTTAPTGYVDTIHWNGAGGLIAAALAKTAISPYRLY